MITSRLAEIERILEQEQQRWFIWGPVCFGAGISFYFSFNEEPALLSSISSLLIAVCLRYWFCDSSLKIVLSSAILLSALGFSNAKLRTVLVKSPVLKQKTRTVKVSGWIEKIELAQPRGHRLTLRTITLEGFKTSELPYRIRLKTLSKMNGLTIGNAVQYRAVLQPPPDPVMPGGFDFSRKAWFSRLGAVGYTVSKPKKYETEIGTPLLLRIHAFVGNYRNNISTKIVQVLPDTDGAVANALITGKRGGIGEVHLNALRESGLAHILAISGLHMSLIAGTIYWATRYMFAAWPRLVLTRPIKQWAAVVATFCGAFYLTLSGFSIATQRAFIMIAIMFFAICLGRPALSLRNVALAAFAFLIPWPELIFDTSFQMSFAAVVALVALYEKRPDKNETFSETGKPNTKSNLFLSYFKGLALTSIVAGLAVAPFAAFHFHKLAQFSLVANLIAMPLVGFWIMPAALVSLISMPVGLEYWPLQTMGYGVNLLLDAAIMVSGWKGATLRFPSIPVISLVWMSFGGLWLCLWQRKWRVMGLLPFAFGLFLTQTNEIPDILISRDGTAVAVRSSDGLLKAIYARSDKFSLEEWLKSDGDGRDIEEIASADKFRCDDRGCVTRIRDRTIAITKHAAALAEDCEKADIVIISHYYTKKCPKARVVINLKDLKSYGAHAIYLRGHSIKTENVASRRGNRPWVRNHPPINSLQKPGTAFAEE